MRDQEEQSLKETKRMEKRVAEEARLLAKEQVRRKANLAREQAIENTSKAKKIERMEKRAAEEVRQSARDQARRKANLAREQATAEAQETRKLKSKKQTRE